MLSCVAMLAPPHQTALQLNKEPLLSPSPFSTARHQAAPPSSSAAPEPKTGPQQKPVTWQGWEDAPLLCHAGSEGTISRKPIMAFCSHPEISRVHSPRASLQGEADL